jgi:hypothetical protein
LRGLGNLATPVISNTSKRSLISIAKALQVANRVIREEARRDKQQCEQNSNVSQIGGFPTLRTKSYFEDHDLQILDRLNGLRVPGPGEDITELLQALADTSCLSVWRNAIDSLLEFQDRHFDAMPWKLAKQRALDILQQRDHAVEIFQDVEGELRSRTAEDLCSSILQKTKMLERFTAIYDAQPSPIHMDHNPGQEPCYHLSPMENRRSENFARAYPQLQQHVSLPTL